MHLTLHFSLNKMGGVCFVIQKVLITLPSYHIPSHVTVNIDSYFNYADILTR